MFADVPRVEREEDKAVIAYTRVSTGEQADSGLGLEAQREAIARVYPGELRWITDGGYSASSLARPGLAEALELLADGTESGIVVAKLDRLSRSLLDFASLMALAQKQSWSLVALDVGVDTSTPAGELMVSVMASFAQYERKLIGQRTRDALAAASARGQRLGRPRSVPQATRERIRGMREGGASLARIAAVLTEDGTPTGQGGKAWYPSTVRRQLS